MNTNSISFKGNEDVGRLLRVIELLIHIFWWIIYIGFHFSYFVGSFSSKSFLFSYYGLSILIEMGLFYVFYFWLIPKFWVKGKKRWLLLLVPLALGFYPVVDIAADRLTEYQFQEENEFVNEFYRGFRDGINYDRDPAKGRAPVDLPEDVPYVMDYSLRLINGFFMVVLSFVFWVSIAWFKKDKLKSELKSDNLTNELLWLRSQINPHFLFNTLNNIYYLVYSKSDAAPSAVLKLSAIMRYMLYDSNAPQVPLEKEVAYLHDYINLHKMRVKEENAILFNVGGTIDHKMIAPVLLVPFVENAFKHGHFSDADPLLISLFANEEKIEFEVINGYKDVPEESKDSVGGIGLVNIRRRLSLIYPERHNLSINKLNNKFKVSLTIQG